MALTGLIPIGRTPIDYLTEGTKGFNDIFNRIRQAGLEQQKINDMVNYHKSSIGLQGAAGARAAELLPFTIQNLKDTHLMNQMKYDPDVQQSMLERLMGMINGENAGGNPLDTGMPLGGEDSDPWGPSTPEAQAAFAQGNPAPLTSASQSKPKPKIDFEAIARHPVGRMMLKNMGYDVSGSKESPLQGAAREVDDLRRFGEKVGFDSPAYKQAEAIVKAKEANRERHNRGLKPGENLVYDKKTGEEIGFQRDYSPAEKKEIKGRVFFNDSYPFMNKALSYYSGEESVRKFTDDVRRYKTDKAAKQRIDDFLVAQKMLASNTIKENATIGGSNTYKAFDFLRSSLDSTDIPKRLESIAKQYGLPAEAQRDAGTKMLAMLNKATNKSENIPAKHTEYYDPQKQMEKEVEEKYPEKEINDEAKYFGTTPDMIKKALALGLETEEELRAWLAEQ